MNDDEVSATAPAGAGADPPLVVIGASSGGVDALLRLAAALPANLPAMVAAVVHIGTQPSILPELLRRAGPLPARHPRDGERLHAGTLYVAPPDHHLVLDKAVAHLSRGPRENHTRPAIDPLFRSAALGWRSRVIGVVLTGQLDDGTAGLAAIKSCGGVAIVQDPADCVAPSMPLSALANVEVDHCLPLDAIAPLLVRLVGLPPRGGTGEPPEMLRHEQAVFNGVDPMENLAALGEPSQLTCPECGGTLTEVRESRPLRYRCHTGHAYTALTLHDAQAARANHSLQSSLRALKEREFLLRRLAMVSEKLGDLAAAQAGRQQADRVHEQAAHLAKLMQEETSGA
ncbi:MAG TPA: chemotaxis protein CheB [Ramlibacter sp.]|jgi:two-component system chemotaxis response regulator CheB|uniref:chemotaxis protein CheB n=1 Tax=Ramlibacter sp. TaxID=1917967 RepID=UPI002D4635C2|nr:chemotaxis protein CheB [Ramlibacter sp.]HZY16911.1 chemotaxis protein CheB [Ramlibacter sp.]